MPHGRNPEEFPRRFDAGELDVVSELLTEVVGDVAQ